MRTTLLALVLTLPCTIAVLPAAPATPAADEPQPPNPDDVAFELQKFFANCARPDGSFQPGTDPKYDGISDSAYSDLAPTVYAVILHKTFGWKLPDEAKTRAFLLSR